MLDLTHGHDSALLKSVAVSATTIVEEGEWIVIDAATGKGVKQVGAYDPVTQGAVYQVYGGNKVRFDSKALGVVTACLGKGYVGTTDKVEAVTIKNGDFLTVKDGVLTKATAGTTADLAIVASCTKTPVGGVIEFTRL